MNPVTSNITRRELVSKNYDKNVGFSNLPNQFLKRILLNEFEFNLMVVGESGLGKATLINSLFQADIFRHFSCDSNPKKDSQDLYIDQSTFKIIENGVHLKLTVIDIHGYDQNNSDSLHKIDDYISSKLNDYLLNESQYERSQISDSRVHCCLYFLNNSFHGLRKTDIEFIKLLQEKVNIIPIISKADCLTLDELKHLKQMILKDLSENSLNVYDFPIYDDGFLNDETKKELIIHRSKFPFATIASTNTVNHNGKVIRARVYKWGIVDIENPNNCDFVALRDLIIRTHMFHLITSTHDIHYERYRSICMQESTKFSSVLEDEMKVQELKLQKLREGFDNSLEEMITLKNQHMKKISNEFQVYCNSEKISISILKDAILTNNTTTVKHMRSFKSKLGNSSFSLRSFSLK